MSIKDLQQTVARTSTSTDIHGTAFLISSTHALTCAHCLGKKEQCVREVALHFSHWADAKEVNANVVDCDWDNDVALLALHEPANVQPLQLSYTVAEDDPWKSFAYPKQRANDGLTLSGHIGNPNALSYERPVLQLDCTQAKDKVNGASGGPVMVDGCIVAMLNQQMLEYTESGGIKPVFDALHGIPLSALKSWLAPHLPDKKDKIQPDAGNSTAITITLRRNNNALIRTFADKNGKFDEFKSPWKDYRVLKHCAERGIGALNNDDLGRTLFAVLFGADEDRSGKILQRLFQTAGMARPILSPLRVCILTEDPCLRCLPWSRTRWKASLLQDFGWTFEQVGQPQAEQNTVVTLSLPCPVLYMTDVQSQEQQDSHFLDFQGAFCQHWSHHREQFLVRANNNADITSAIQTRRPHIIYYFGHAEVIENVLFLRLTPNGKPISIKALAQLWAGRPPQVLFLNLLGASLPVQHIFCKELHDIPLVVIQPCLDENTHKARTSALRWLRLLLQSREPVWEMHQHGLPSTMIWTAYRQWTSQNEVGNGIKGLRVNAILPHFLSLI